MDPYSKNKTIGFGEEKQKQNNCQNKNMKFWDLGALCGVGFRGVALEQRAKTIWEAATGVLEED